MTNGGAPRAPFERVDQGGHDARTAGAQRVADCDGAAVDVGLGKIGTDILGPGEGRFGGAKLLPTLGLGGH